MASPLESLVDATYVINLAHRKDRWESAQAQLAAIGYDNYERLDAYSVANFPPDRYYAGIPNFAMSGWWGNKFSHYSAIERARDAGARAVAVFEDDVMFHPLFRSVILGVMTILERVDWDWFSLGGNHRFFQDDGPTHSPIDGMAYPNVVDGLIPIIKDRTVNLGRISKMLTAHAYIAKAETFDFILRHAIASPLSIDGFYGHEVHPRFRCYAAMPCLARQIPGTNDIGGGHFDYTWYVGD